jgi:mycothiol system anti-sigma-R factor
MNCQEALDLLYDIIDKEASDIDVKEVQAHLDECRHCAQVYHVEESIQALIKQKVQNQASEPEVNTLRVRILEQIDDIDREQGSSTRRRPPFFRLATSLAMAASLVLVVGAAFLASQLYRHHNVALPLEQSHWNAAKRIADFQNATATASTLGLINHQLNYTLNDQEDGFLLTGGKTEEILGCEWAHFVYSNGNSYVSVFVAPASDFEIPKDARENPVQFAGLTLYDHNCRGCRLVYHLIGNAVVVTATTERNVDLIEFLPGSGTI